MVSDNSTSKVIVLPAWRYQESVWDQFGTRRDAIVSLRGREEEREEGQTEWEVSRRKKS
jgi:hypothetical protein